MPIYQKNDTLNNDQKNAVKGWLKKIIKSYRGDFPFELTKILNEEIKKISKSPNINVIELSIYLKAVVIHLKLEKVRLFDQRIEHKLLAALRYFIEVVDVIPDWEEDGYDDECRADQKSDRSSLSLP